MLLGEPIERKIKIVILSESSVDEAQLKEQLHSFNFKFEAISINSIDEMELLLQKKLPDLVMISGNKFDKERIIKFLERLKRGRQSFFVPVILILNGEINANLKIELIKAGLDSIIINPVSLKEFQVIVEKHIKTKLANEEMEHVEKVLFGYVHALEARDKYISGHSTRVSELAVMIARIMHLSKFKQQNLYAGALLHDIGKIGIPDRILKKEESLTAEEMKEIKRHPIIGYNILKPLMSFKNMLNITRHHHERWDGRGYPDALAGHNISIEARILAVADAIDAMLSNRPYRKGVSVKETESILKRYTGMQWDADVVTAALEGNLVNTAARYLRCF